MATAKTARMRRAPTGPKRLSQREFREKAEQLTEAMIALLDAFDGDENLEPSLGYQPVGTKETDLEPSIGSTATWDGKHFSTELEMDPGEDDIDLGWTEDVNQARAERNLIAAGELTIPHAETQHDGREPSLGSISDTVDQERWANGRTNDAEGDEHDGGEPDDELNEDSLGWRETGNQTRIRADCSNSWTEMEGPDDDREPSLGAPEARINPEADPFFLSRAADQTMWARGGGDDREHDDDCEAVS